MTYLISLVLFTFGALAFTALAVSWAVWGRRTSRALTSFTYACAVAFLANLLLAAANAAPAAQVWIDALGTLREIATAILPVLMLEVIWAQEEAGVAWKPAWRTLIWALYLVSSASASYRWGASGAFADRLENMPAIVLGITGVAGLAIVSLSRRPARLYEVRLRWWYRVLLALMFVAAVLGLSQAADYLLLTFFAATLYYRERLAFFDVLIKQGAFFALSLAAMTFFFATAPAFYERFPDDWSRPWICALLLTPLAAGAPWIYKLLAVAVDRLWLGRPCSAAEAERQFASEIQLATTEEELQAHALASLGAIFRTKAEMRKDGLSAALDAGEDRLMEPVEQRHGGPAGWIFLAPRENALPFLSDDRRLLQSLARTLSVVLENVRFRQEQRRQQEREQELRLLASRAELRALRAQINPHFLFNALNAIAGLIPDNPALADETVEQLAQVFRYTLRKSEKEWTRLDDEVDFAQAYLRVEQARFGERLRVQFDIESRTEPVPIPTMTIQPLIENAVKHGVAEVEGPASVAVRSRMTDSDVVVEVFDNGPGFPAGVVLGHGLRNVADRVRGYYGDAACLWWENGADGTRVFLKFPRQGANGV